MKSTEFAYWLQGYFEISCYHSEAKMSFSETQVDCIQSHLKLVFEYEKNKTSPFCNWLQGFLADKECLTAGQVEILKNRLSSEFEHVIDSSYGDSKLQEALNKIHPPFGPNTKIRC